MKKLTENWWCKGDLLMKKGEKTTTYLPKAATYQMAEQVKKKTLASKRPHFQCGTISFVIKTLNINEIHFFEQNFIKWKQ